MIIKTLCLFILLQFLPVGPMTLFGQFFASGEPARVRIVEGRSGEPIAGLYVGIEDLRAKVSRACGETGQDGTIDLGIDHGDYVLIINGNEEFLGTLMKGRTGFYSVPLSARDSVDADAERRRLESGINEVLRAKGYGELAYKLSKAIIWGGNAVDVAGALLTKLPGLGTAISVPGVWEMSLRIHDGKLGWELSGSLVDAQFKYLSIFKVPSFTSSQSTSGTL